MESITLGNGRIYLYERKQDNYTIKRTTFNVPKEVRKSIEGREDWESGSEHPSVFDEDLNAILIFRDMDSYHNFLECKRNWKEKDRMDKEFKMLLEHLKRIDVTSGGKTKTLYPPKKKKGKK